MAARCTATPRRGRTAAAFVALLVALTLLSTLFVDVVAAQKSTTTTTATKAAATSSAAAEPSQATTTTSLAAATTTTTTAAVVTSSAAANPQQQTTATQAATSAAAPATSPSVWTFVPMPKYVRSADGSLTGDPAVTTPVVPASSPYYGQVTGKSDSGAGLTGWKKWAVIGGSIVGGLGLLMFGSYVYTKSSERKEKRQEMESLAKHRQEEEAEKLNPDRAAGPKASNVAYASRNESSSRPAPAPTSTASRPAAQQPQAQHYGYNGYAPPQQPYGYGPGAVGYSAQGYPQNYYGNSAATAQYAANYQASGYRG
ncbi:hypothetical protein DFJ73DRAFT_839670 [Zopfochytrium polystomum]|nr:hypothetical protein DFJ73DRAFT_839670 [Zopfochytrium polystomum]